MADQGRWFKLWLTAEDDPDLGNLSLENFARWCKLGMYIKAHGTEGTLKVNAPAMPLQHKFRCNSFENVCEILKHFPNCAVTTDVTSVTVTWQNWKKYQGDNSSERVARFRSRVTVDVTPKKRREEKRRDKEEKIGKKNVLPAVPEWIPSEAWEGYMEVRRLKKYPITERVVKSLIAELDRLRGIGQPVGAVLEKATRNGWRDVYPLKEDELKSAVRTPRQENMAEIIKKGMMEKVHG